MRLLLCALTFCLVPACGNPVRACDERTVAVAQKMSALAEKRRSGCTTDADCLVFPMNTTCVSNCDAVVLQASAALLQSELDHLSETDCAGLQCKLGGQCAGPIVAACAGGFCVNGRPDGGPE